MSREDDDSTLTVTMRTQRRRRVSGPDASTRLRPADPGGVAGGGSPPPQDEGADAPPAPLPCGRFELHAPIGRGAFGSVWRGRDRQSGLPVAVKVVLAEVADTERASLLHEARAVAALEHPGIVRIVDLGAVTAAEAASGHGHLTEGATWLAMDLVRGGTLRDEAGRMDWPRLKDVLLQLLAALAHAHAAGIVHRDLKPANVLREGRRIIVSDFGIAALGGAAPEDLVRGTPAYMAPEQIEGDWRSLGPWTDLYSVGCMAWALATGRPPFPGRGSEVMQAQLREPPPAFQPNHPMPPGFEAWLRRLLHKRPAERPQFAADAARALLTIDGAAAPESPLPASWQRLDGGPSDIDVADGERLIGLRTLPLVGRVAERDQLWAHLRRVVERDATVVDVLRGPAGIGKTRLAGWLCQRAHERGVARVVDLSVGTDFLRAAGAAVARSAGADGLPARDAEERLAACFGALLARADLSALAELCAPGTGASRLDQAVWRHALLGRWIRALSVERPVVLRIEDAHRDAEALAFAQSLLLPANARLRTPGEHGVLALVTVKDDALDGTGAACAAALSALAGAGGDVFSIGPLDEDEQRALLRAVSGGVRRRGVGMAPALASAALRHADGNPLHLEQIVRGWAASGAVVQTAEGLRSRDGRVPPVDLDLSTAWKRRLAQILGRHTMEERAAVEIAATIGARFEIEVWQRACASAGVAGRPRALDALVEQRFVARPRGAAPGTFAFMHGGLREALLADARASGRAKRWHLACARAFDAAPGAYLRERAQHLAAAGQHDEALASLAVAATAAARRGREEVSRELAALRRQVLVQGGYPESHPAHGEQLCLEAENAIGPEQWPLVEELSGRAIRLGRAHGWDATVARALLQRARLNRHLGRPSAAAADSGEAVEALRALGTACPPEWLAMALRVRGMALAVPWLRKDEEDAHARRLDEAGAVIAEARALYASIGEDTGVGQCDLALATVFRSRNDAPAARRALRSARQALQRSGHIALETVAIYDLADMLRVEGDLDGAEAGFQEAHALLRSVGLRDDIVDCNLALALAERGRHAEAIARLEVLRANITAVGGLPLLVYVVAALARCRYALGEVELGREAFEATVAILEQVPFADQEVAHTLTACARHAFACGDGPVALRAAELGRRLAESASVSERR